VAAPFRSVQFNHDGVQSGSAGFLFYRDETSIVVGALSSITAAAFESCHVFGHDCHIGDP
jgi:hypothetical protein